MHHKLRRIALFHQGLTRKKPFGKGIQATEKALQHLGYVQIDTLSVVERAHHHTLWTRIPDYQSKYLNKLVQERKAFEYWFHAASYLPIRDYQFALRKMAAIKSGESHYHSTVDPKCMRYVMDRIRGEGPLKARDFESATSKNGKWWNWKPTKRALEKLFMQGDLMISSRDGMEKVYDLAENFLPEGVNTCEPSLAEFSEYLVRTSLNANGFTTIKQLAHLRKGTSLRKKIHNILQQKIEQGEVAELSIDGMPPVYASINALEAKIRLSGQRVRLLSPFDNAVIHRDRVQQLFGFDYRLECYTVKEKRQFGYFCLPVLYGDQLVGRVDCKAHRRMSLFEIIHLHVNDKVRDPECFIALFTQEVRRFAAFNGCHSVILSSVSPKKLESVVRKAFTTD
ncbi:winged helix-turn-helix domain-containing protein [Motiliproteus sp. MSK22-1]|uniref:winged helix-turn-helix domain-containing protein n=1 Tax=Motiliproteus sp. MSK22-1 TaxID=1897630 RepID=UPI00117C322E|nr:crosslink repair DNA glycosylase YcaQ family protein [Motiliproteus sp. MSK22-1]